MKRHFSETQNQTFKSLEKQFSECDYDILLEIQDILEEEIELRENNNKEGCCRDCGTLLKCTTYIDEIEHTEDHEYYCTHCKK